MWFSKETEEKAPTCDHEVCVKCGHLIEKFSGKRVTHIRGIFLPFSPLPIPSEATDIYCKTCAPAYDYHNTEYAKFKHLDPIYKKKIEPWKIVNEDGTDYVEPKTPKNK